MDIHAPEAWQREDRDRQNQSIGHDHQHIRPPRAQLVDGLDGFQALRLRHGPRPCECLLPDRTRREPPAPTGRAIRLREDSDDPVARRRERPQGGQRKLRRAGKRDAQTCHMGRPQQAPGSERTCGHGRRAAVRGTFPAVLLELLADALTLQLGEIINKQAAVEVVHLML